MQQPSEFKSLSVYIPEWCFFVQTISLDWFFESLFKQMVQFVENVHCDLVLFWYVRCNTKLNHTISELATRHQHSIVVLSILIFSPTSSLIYETQFFEHKLNLQWIRVETPISHQNDTVEGHGNWVSPFSTSLCCQQSVTRMFNFHFFLRSHFLRRNDVLTMISCT